MKKFKEKSFIAGAVITAISFGLCGCGNKDTSNKTVVEKAGGSKVF